MGHVQISISPGHSRIQVKLVLLGPIPVTLVLRHVAMCNRHLRTVQTGHQQIMETPKNKWHRRKMVRSAQSDLPQPLLLIQGILNALHALQAIAAVGSAQS